MPSCRRVPWLALLALPAAVAAQEPAVDTEPLVYCDLTRLFALDLNDPAQRRRLWDETQVIVALQGLANRERPRLYLRYVRDPDDFWWGQMTAPGGWLAGRTVQRTDRLPELLDRFRDAYTGLVAWDERVPATSNLAATIAGCDRLLCIRRDAAPGSLFQELTAGPAALPVKVDLRAPDGGPLFTGRDSGSAKNDAYRWLIERYVRTGRANARTMGYYLDGYWLTAWRAGSPELHTLTNQDYGIAHGGVLFDLDVWDDESPVDEPNAPPGADAETLRLLLRAAYDQVHGEETIHVAGFVPWAYKYTNWSGNGCAAGGKHDPVPTEWRYAEILSCYNAYMDADAIGLSAMANASFYQHYPLRESYPQHRRTREELTAEGILDGDGRIVPRHYVAHYVGDYDAAAWLYQQLPRMWSDPARGSVPLSWAFNPNLAERFPLGMAWARERATANDVFVAGDSGAGYLNPGYLTEPRPHSGLPSGLLAWERHCTRLYRQWDLGVTGFVIDGFARGLDQAGLDAYARFSPEGIVAQKIGRSGVHAGMPTLRMSGDLPHDPAAAAAAIARQCSGPAPTFHVWRSILKPPSWYVAVSAELERQAGAAVRVVDMVTLLRLVSEFHTHAEIYRPADARCAALRELEGRPDSAADLWPVWVDDGPFSVVEQAGARCWKLPAHQPPYYLYFALHDGFYRAGQGPLSVEVEYLDSGAGRFGLQYDSTDPAAALDGAYKDAPEQVSRANTGEWLTARWTIAGARLQGRQNGDADFRLFNPGGDLYVRAVRLRKAGG